MSLTSESRVSDDAEVANRPPTAGRQYARAAIVFVPATHGESKIERTASAAALRNFRMRQPLRSSVTQYASQGLL